MQTTPPLVPVDNHRITLYYSGRRHAGENIDELLRYRPAGLAPPKQVGDALASNWSREFETIICKCLVHACRQFIDIEAAFPAECARVLDDLATVYRRDAETRGMSERSGSSIINSTVVR